MYCSVCFNKHVSCALSYNNPNKFKIVLGDGFQTRVYVPCPKRDCFNSYHVLTATLVTPEGIPFNVIVQKECGVTYIHGQEWRELVRQYSLKLGDIIKIRLSTQDGDIGIKLLSDDNTIPKRPIFGTFCRFLTGAQYELVESMVVSKETHVTLEEMDAVSWHLIAQGQGATKPWVHTLTARDLKYMSVQLGWYSHFN